MALTGGEFEQHVLHNFKSWLPARELVRKSLERRFEVDPSGAIVRLEDFSVWKSHLLAIEEELQFAQPILYVLYCDTSNAWRIQCVPEKEDSFVCRQPLPEAWRGVRDQALSDLSGIDQCIFVHASGFIGGAHTYDAVLAMARTSLENSNASVNSSQQAHAFKKQKLDA